MGTDTLGDTRSPSEAVLHEVAEHKGISPEELNPPLYDVIDPEALDTIFRKNTGRITFEYHGYVVTVDASGNVNLETTDSD